MPTPPLSLDRASGTPLYRQLEDQLRAAIGRRELTPGARLPAIRELADELRVARITVVTAYDQLVAEGLLVPRVGSGTRVADDAAALVAPAVDGRSVATVLPVPAAPRERGGTVVWDLRPGRADASLMPLALWERLLRTAWTELRDAPGVLEAPDRRGDPLLRHAIAQRLAAARGIRVTPESIVVAGSRDGVLLAASAAWLGPGRTCVVEDPGAAAAHRAIAGAGTGLIPIEVGHHGLAVDRLPRHADAACVSPSWQFPCGGTLALEARHMLLRWAGTTGALVIEDDSGGEPRYAGPPVPALRALDRDGRVLSLGDFTDLMLPGVHLAWASVPGDGEDAWAAAFADLAGRGAGAVEQRAAARFLLEGHVERHARRLRVALEERGTTLVSSLRRELGRSVDLVRPAAGTHLVVGLRGAGDPALVARRAASAGVRIATLAEYALVPPAENRLVIGYAGTPPDDIEAAVRALAAVIRAPLPAPVPRPPGKRVRVGTAGTALVAR